MEHSTPALKGHRLLSYIQTLAETKKGLPYGLPISVAPSHTVTTTEALVQLASLVGPHIVIYQIFADIIDDWSDETVRQLTTLAKKHGFLIWETGRILNATVDVAGRQKAESREVRNELVDLARKKYTKGVVRPATWASMATAWASGVAVGNQEADILIPTLKAAAREAVADSTQTIRTEITADKRPTTGNESTAKEEPPQHLTSDYAVGDHGLGLPPRKSSTISLTQTITQHTEDSTESLMENEPFEVVEFPENSQRKLSTTDDGLLPPPLLARGLVLCLPSTTETSFTPEYRKSCFAAARANPDFVMGFLCSEPWHIVSQQDSIPGMGSFEQEVGQQMSPYSNDEEEAPCFALFSLVSHRLNLMSGKHLETYNEENEDHDNDETADKLAPLDPSQSSDAESPLVAKLYSVVGQAIKFRDAFRNRSEPTPPGVMSSNGPKTLHIPVVSLP